MVDCGIRAIKQGWNRTLRGISLLGTSNERLLSRGSSRGGSGLVGGNGVLREGSEHVGGHLGLVCVMRLLVDARLVRFFVQLLFGLVSTL